MELVYIERIRRRLEFDRKFEELQNEEQNQNNESIESELNPIDKSDNDKININIPQSDQKVIDGAIIFTIIDNAAKS